MSDVSEKYEGSHHNMCGVLNSGSCFVTWCTCPCHSFVAVPITPPSDETPSDAELNDIEVEGIAEHWGGDLIALGNARQLDVLNVGRRALFNAGRASVTPTREALAETLIAAEVAKPLRGLVDTGKPRPTHYAQADALLALLGAVPSTENEAKP
jgi:hypothetical protein